ncbi:Mur ligase family protein [Massilia solisilvae]|uniref:Mur ligase family protein n=1 Tax=Massilia solisilvae TaxID=1811225 RepID=A0ABT2BMY3_9BURK|nr:Mur ligase family protein [Massilia solisilvae]MCS0609766.1 Mur ligase family protein [Massilia solisilvae]
MRIKEQRVLRGPNLYAETPCLLAEIDAAGGPGMLPDLHERLLALLPALPTGAAKGLASGASIDQAIEPVAMHLQTEAGAPAGFSHTVASQGGQYHIACGYECEQVAALALATTVELLNALVRGEQYPMAEALERLRAAAARHAIGTSTAAVLAAAQRRGIPSMRLLDQANLFQLGWGSRQKRLQATITGATNAIAVGIARNKQLTKTLLEQAGVPVPAGATVDSLEDALRVARQLGGIVTVKPLDANQGKGVTTTCGTPDQVERAWEHARGYGPRVIVEEYLAGRDYRVLVTGTRVAAASWRRPPFVTGDGRHSVRELVECENRNPARGDGHTKVLTRIALDELAVHTLAAQGYSADCVPAAGVDVQLRGNANLSTGGTAEDVTDLLPDETRELCVRAARTIGLDVAGIDIVCEDIARPLREQHGGIIEVNAAPGIRMHQYPSHGKPRNAGAAIVEQMFGEDDGRIPVIGVSGSTGATTTTLLIGHAARMAGMRTGMTTADGVYISGNRTMQGDCTGYRCARSVLASPEVDIAVLETGHDGVLQHGLAFDRCDVAVVLNVADDGEARLQAVVARGASRAVVLNAEDDRCVAMAADLKERIEVLYVSLDAENPVLLRHLEGGGRGAYLLDHTLVIADGMRHKALIDAHQMRISAGGVARHLLASALAATCALAASGFGDLEIRDALRSFTWDSMAAAPCSNASDAHGVSTGAAMDS